MADFNIAYNQTSRNEGGYANNPHDRGGETWKGVARNMFPAWSGWTIVDHYKNKRTSFPAILAKDPELEKLVRSFYKDNFWNKLLLDQVKDQRIANELYDTAVNMGVGTASLFLQKALNAANRNGKNYADLQLDGKVGARTIDTLNNHKSPGVVYKLLNCLQGAKYIGICERDPSQEIFMYGWMDRVFENH